MKRRLLLSVALVAALYGFWVVVGGAAWPGGGGRPPRPQKKY